jgi:hypothetical protein
MHTEPAIMQNNDRNANSAMPDRLYGEHYPDSFLDVSRPIRESSVATLGDYIRHLQEVDKQSNESDITCESSKSNESKFDHICPNNPILTCNCADPNACAELGNDPDSQHGNKRCPDSGRICHESVCPNECLGDKDGFADNINYTGIPIPQGQSKKLGWPCVVVGAVCETWATASECVPRGEHSAGNIEQHIDAGFNNDGSATTTKLQPTI